MLLAQRGSPESDRLGQPRQIVRGMQTRNTRLELFLAAVTPCQGVCALHRPVHVVRDVTEEFWSLPLDLQIVKHFRNILLRQNFIRHRCDRRSSRALIGPVVTMLYAEA